MDSPGPDYITEVGQQALNAVPTFDIGFQLPEANQVEHALGMAAINTEDIHQALTDAVEQHLNQAVTNTSLIHTTLTDNAYGQLQQAEKNTETIQQALEASLAGQMGLPLEHTQTIAPDNLFMKSVAPVTNPFGAVNAADFGLGANPPPKSGLGLSMDIKRPTQFPYDVCAAIGALGQDAAFSLIGNTYFAGYMNMNGPPVKGTNPVQYSQGPVVAVNVRSDDHSGLAPSSYQIVAVDPHGFDMTLGFTQMCSPWPATDTSGGIGGIKETLPCPPCPPPSKLDINWPDCIKICDTTPKKCEEPVYQVYCNKETGILSVVLRSDASSTTGPNKGTKIGEGTASSIDWLALCGKCSVGKDTLSDIEQGGNDPKFQLAQGCGGLFNFPMLANPGDLTTIFDVVRDQLDEAKKRNHEINGAIAAPILDSIYDFVGLLAESGDVALEAITNIINGGGCQQPNTFGITALRALLGLCGKFVGNAVQPLDRQAEYALNEICPYVLPTAENATAQYLTNSIDVERLRCLVQANGYMWEPWKATVDSNRTRWNAQEALMLWRRNFMNEGSLDGYLRQLGYLSDEEKSGLKKLTEQVPAVSDLMSMMVRDVEDTVNVDWRESDAIFKDKWAGQLKEWGDNQGVPELMAKYIWRAHWTIPAPTQLFEFWKRLRKTGQFGTEAEFYKKIKGALLQQDILPQWIDAYLQVSFHPLTRVDSKRAYQIGALDEDGLNTAFLDAGYSDANAGVMVDFTKRQLKVATTKNPIIKRYVAGEINSATMQELLADQGLPQEMIDYAVNYAKAEVGRSSQKVCVASLRKRYLLGEFNADSVLNILQYYQLDTDQIEALQRKWSCEKSARGKAVSASILCGWYQRGAITEIDLYSRLQNLGYTTDDAAELTRDCMYKQGLSMDKAKEKKLKEEKTLQKQSDAASRRNAKQLLQAQQKAQATSDKATATKEKRQSKILDISEVWAKKTGISYADSVRGVSAVINAMVARTFYSINVVISAAENAAKNADITTFAELAQTMTDLLSGVGVT